MGTPPNIPSAEEGSVKSQGNVPQVRKAATVEPSATKSDVSRDSALVYRYTVFTLTCLAGIAAFGVSHFYIRNLAEPSHTLAFLACCAGFLVLGGLVFLIFVIPAAASSPHAGVVKTEFHAARAAYLCVATGLVVFVVVAIGASTAELLKLRGR